MACPNIDTIASCTPGVHECATRERSRGGRGGEGSGHTATQPLNIHALSLTRYPTLTARGRTCLTKARLELGVTRMDRGWTGQGGASPALPPGVNAARHAPAAATDIPNTHAQHTQHSTLTHPPRQPTMHSAQNADSLPIADRPAEGRPGQLSVKPGPTKGRGRSREPWRLQRCIQGGGTEGETGVQASQSRYRDRFQV